MRNILKQLFLLDTHHHPIDKIAQINSIISGFALYPQLIKILLGHSAQGLSYTTFLLIAVNSIVWVIYGYHRNTMPLLVSSILNAISSVGILLLIVL